MIGSGAILGMNLRPVRRIGCLSSELAVLDSYGWPFNWRQRQMIYSTSGDDAKIVEAYYSRGKILFDERIKHDVPQFELLLRFNSLKSVKLSSVYEEHECTSLLLNILICFGAMTSAFGFKKLICLCQGMIRRREGRKT